jgi:hypothetical protein
MSPSSDFGELLLQIVVVKAAMTYGRSGCALLLISLSLCPGISNHLYTIYCTVHPSLLFSLAKLPVAIWEFNEAICGAQS